VHKGPKRPINNEQDRAHMLAALNVVDHVVVFNEKDPRQLLSCLKPHIHVNGSEYGKECIEADVVKEGGGKIHIVSLKPGYSTSELIKKIVEANKE